MTEPDRKCGLEAPVLNLEVSAAKSEIAKSRDKHFVTNQNVLGSAIVALGEGVSILLNPDEEIDRNSLLQHLCDSGKLLTDLFHQQSVT